MPISSRLSLRYPATTDTADVPRDLGYLASDIDSAVVYGQGATASRPVSTAGTPGIAGRVYRDTTLGVVYWDTGTSWVEIGTVADGSITSAKIADGTIATGDLASSVGNFGAWTAFTTTWGSGGTAPAINNGTIVSAYAQIGKIVTFRILLTAGNITTFGNSYFTFTVPVTAASGAAGSFTTIGNAVALDASASLIYEATVCLFNTTQVFVRYQTSNLFGQTTPFTFANTDTITARSIRGWGAAGGRFHKQVFANALQSADIHKIGQLNIANLRWRRRTWLRH